MYISENLRLISQLLTCLPNPHETSFQIKSFKKISINDLTKCNVAMSIKPYAKLI